MHSKDLDMVFTIQVSAWNVGSLAAQAEYVTATIPVGLNPIEVAVNLSHQQDIRD